MLASIARTVAPRGARFISTAAKKQPQLTAATNSQSATITTTASSIAKPGPSSSQRHIVAQSGHLKSANRHYHANGSESSAGLSEIFEGPSARQVARMNRMKEAKELAGL